MIGKSLAHYEILEKIGTGGMGEVYRARDTKLGREVALKILPPDAAADPERRERFQREAKAVASIQHPHIVTIHSIEKVDGVRFLTMELVRGSTLAELIPTDGLPLQQLFEIGIPLADAVHAAHEQGVIHRDLKPGNVMIDTAGQIKVLDFGLAKLIGILDDPETQTMAAGDSTQEGRILGTVAYMSPEQVEGKNLDRRSDVFSLGVLLYEAATGQRPFSGDTAISTMSAILRESPSPATSLKPLPRHLGRIIGRCLEKNPDKRPQTARDIANELEGLQREIASGELEPIASEMESGNRSATHRNERRVPAWPWLAGAAVIISILIGWMVTTNPPRTGQLTTRRLTSHFAPEWVGSWSPDGSFFAFDRTASGPQDVFVASTAGGDAICLVESPADDFSARWSPDNRWIAFVSNREGMADIYLIPPLGGAVRKLAETGAEGLGDESGAVLGMQPWSPDGRQLAFSRVRDNRFSVWVVDIETGRETQLTHPEQNEFDLQPSWSFDGERIAFGRVVGATTTISVIPAGGGAVEPIATGGGSTGSPSWSPDGKQLVYQSDEGEVSNLWAVDLDGGASRQLTSGSIDVELPVVGRNGQILYGNFRHQTDLYEQRFDGTKPRRLTFNTESNFGARVSPTGDRLVYHSDRTGSDDLWMLQLDSGAEHQLTDHPSGDLQADWSPDGSQIVFVSFRSGSAQLWRMNAEGGIPTQLTEQDGVVGQPRWAPDGSGIGFLATNDEGQAVWLLGPDGESAKLLTPQAMDFDWYRDSNCVIYTPRDRPTEIRAVRLDTGEEVVLADEPHLEIAAARDGSALSFCAAQSHFNMSLQVIRLTGPEDGLPRVAGRETVGGGRRHVARAQRKLDARRQGRRIHAGHGHRRLVCARRRVLTARHPTPEARTEPEFAGTPMAGSYRIPTTVERPRNIALVCY